MGALPAVPVSGAGPGPWGTIPPMPPVVGAPGCVQRWCPTVVNGGFIWIHGTWWHDDMMTWWHDDLDGRIPRSLLYTFVAKFQSLWLWSGAEGSVCIDHLGTVPWRETTAISQGSTSVLQWLVVCGSRLRVVEIVVSHCLTCHSSDSSTKVLFLGISCLGLKMPCSSGPIQFYWKAFIEDLKTLIEEIDRLLK